MPVPLFLYRHRQLALKVSLSAAKKDKCFSLAVGYVAARLMYRLICNCRTSESRSKLYLVMPSAANNQ